MGFCFERFEVEVEDSAPLTGCWLSRTHSLTQSHSGSHFLTSDRLVVGELCCHLTLTGCGVVEVEHVEYEFNGRSGAESCCSVGGASAHDAARGVSSDHISSR